VQACVLDDDDEPDQDIVDGKNIMSLMLLAASQGTWLRICTDGEDECEALAAILALIEDKFEEGE
jgi:phosphocarrier protein HPr